MEEKLIRMGLMTWQIDLIMKGVILKTAHGVFKYKGDSVYLKRNGDINYTMI